MPVATFGRVIPQAPWVDPAGSGIPVVIDGAASFDGIAHNPSRALGTIPVALSFHATKAFGAGEGGGAASTDCALIRNVVWALNFGFYGERKAESAGMNGKMSEYHAAVGLAEPDAWHEKERALQSVIDGYRSCVSEAGLAARFIGAPDIGLTYALFRCTDTDEADHVQASLLRHRVGVRLWCSTGLHRQRYFAEALRDSLTVTEAITMSPRFAHGTRPCSAADRPCCAGSGRWCDTVRRRARPLTMVGLLPSAACIAAA